MKLKRIIEIICILSLIAWVSALGVMKLISDRHDLEETTYVVRSGDCLWYIAEDYCPDGMDKRDYICLVSERNDLKSDVLHLGQELIIFVAK